MPPRLPLGFAAFLSFPAIAGAGAWGAGWKRGGIGRGPTFETGNGSAASGEPGTGLSVLLLFSKKEWRAESSCQLQLSRKKAASSGVLAVTPQNCWTRPDCSWLFSIVIIIIYLVPLTW
jgi:hypothetical protein